MSALSVRNMVMGFFRRRSFPIDPSDKADALLVHFAAKGFVLVPVEPTEAMKRAGENTLWGASIPQPAAIYRAMLAAATPPAAKENAR